MLVKGLQATAAINTTQCHDHKTLREGTGLYYNLEKNKFKEHSSINSPTFYVVPVAYNLGYENSQKQQGDMYYWLV